MTLDNAVRSQLELARDLIQSKKYAEARELLNRLDHPTARKWLAKLDDIAPKKTRNNRAFVAATVVLCLLTLFMIAYAGIRTERQDALPVLDGPSATSNAVLTQSAQVSAAVSATQQAAQHYVDTTVTDTLIAYCQAVSDRLQPTCRRWAGTVISQRLGETLACLHTYDWIQERERFDSCLLSYGVAVIGERAIIDPIDMNSPMSESDGVLWTRLTDYCEVVWGNEYCGIWALVTLFDQRTVVEFCDGERRRSADASIFGDCLRQQNVTP